MVRRKFLLVGNAVRRERKLPLAAALVKGGKNRGPCPTSQSDRDPMGGGSAPHSLSRLPTLGAKLAAGSPTLFSMASGVASFGLIAGPFSGLRAPNFE